MGATRRTARRIGTWVAVVPLLAAAAACSGHAPVVVPSAGPQSAADRHAVAALHAWLDDPTTARETLRSVDFVIGSHPERVAGVLTGTADVRSGRMVQHGTQHITAGSLSFTVPETLIEVGTRAYNSVPQALAPRYPGKKWFSGSLAPWQVNGHSVWQAAQRALTAVRRLGPTTVDGRAVTEFAGAVDVTRIPGLSAAWRRPEFAKFGAPLVTIDLFVDTSGRLVLLDYRAGLADTATRSRGSVLSGFSTVLDDFGTTMPRVAAPPADEVTSSPAGEVPAAL